MRLLFQKIPPPIAYVLYYYFAQYLPPTHKNVIGRIGGWIRYHCAKGLFKYVGKNVNIEHRASFGSGKDIVIGDNSGIGVHCHVPNNIVIGQDVMMGPHCYILNSVTHNFDKTDIPIRWQGMRKINSPTIIEDGVWIGRQVLVLPGKRIGANSIIGAGSVVSKNVPNFVVAAGNPIKIIRSRV